MELYAHCAINGPSETNRKNNAFYGQIADKAAGADGRYTDNLSATAQLVHLRGGRCDMPASYVTRFFDRSFEWAITSGLRVLLITATMLVMLALLKRGVAKLSSLYEGTLPGPAQIKRAYTLTHIVRDVARLVILFVGMTMILSEGGVDLKPLLAAA